MNYRLKFLKVKLKSLTAEQHIIRLEKHKAKVRHQTRLVGELNDHRVRVVRPEARATHLAYGLLRGKTLEQMESRAKTEPPKDRINSLIKKYGTDQDRETKQLL